MWPVKAATWGGFSEHRSVLSVITTLPHTHLLLASSGQACCAVVAIVLAYCCTKVCTSARCSWLRRSRPSTACLKRPALFSRIFALVCVTSSLQSTPPHWNHGQSWSRSFSMPILRITFNEHGLGCPHQHPLHAHTYIINSTRYSRRLAHAEILAIHCFSRRQRSNQLFTSPHTATARLPPSPPLDTPGDYYHQVQQRRSSQPQHRKARQRSRKCAAQSTPGGTAAAQPACLTL